MGTASIPRQPSELRSSRSHGGAEQSPKQCQEQGLAPRALPALHPNPNPIPAPSSPTPRPTARSQLHFPATPEIHDFGVVQTQHAPIPAWERSHVADSIPCPAMGTMPSPHHSTPAVGQPVPCSRATQKLGSSLAHPVGSSPCPQPAGGSREDGICPTHLEPLSAACWDGASSFSLFFSSSSFSSSPCVAARDQLVLITAGMGRGCGRPGKGRQPPAPSQMNSSWGWGCFLVYPLSKGAMMSPIINPRRRHVLGCKQGWGSHKGLFLTIKVRGKTHRRIQG